MIPTLSPMNSKTTMGIIRAYVQIMWVFLNKKLGINMQPVEVKTWEEVIRKAENKEIDVLPGIGVTESRKPYLFLQALIYNFKGPSIHGMTIVEAYQFQIFLNTLLVYKRIALIMGLYRT